MIQIVGEYLRRSDKVVDAIKVARVAVTLATFAQCLALALR